MAKSEGNRAAFPSNEKLGCDRCTTRLLCLGEGLTDEQLHGLEGITSTRGPFRAGQAVYKMEEKFKSLFVIKSGSLKIESISHEGNNLVDGFYFRGDLVGLEAIGADRYQHDAVALEETWVCELPFGQLETLCSFMPRLQHKILLLLGQKIRNTNTAIVHGRYLSAEQRLLGFLQVLYDKNVLQHERFRRSVRLVMSKGDIASYLGLRPESLSRALRKLQSKGIIRNLGKRVEILNLQSSLRGLCK